MYNPNDFANIGLPSIDLPNIGSNLTSLPSSTPIQFQSNAALGTTPPASTGGMFDGFLGNTQNGVTTQGWGIPAIQAVGGLANSWLGFQQLGLAEDQFKFQKDAFKQNFNQQAQTINTQLEDRQRARLGANPTGYRSVSEYMNENKVQNYG